MRDGPIYEPLSGPALLSDKREKQLIWAFVILGVAARCVRYFLRFPLWEDECFLCVNFIERGYGDLLKPLHCHQVAPPLFLWAELTAVKLLGYSEMVLRLVPFLASVGALLLFRRLAGRLVRGPALVLAVGVLAVGYPGIRYAAEAKPYGTDLLVSLVLLTLAVRWWQRPGQSRWLWILAGIVPFCLGLSHPAVFIGGGVSLFIGLVLLRRGQLREWLGWGAYNVALLGSSGALFLALTQGQMDSELIWMRQAWQGAFPAMGSAWSLGKWFVLTHVGESMAYPVGGEHGGSVITFLFCVAGVVALCRLKKWPLLVLLLAPAGLQLVAAGMKVYPYGGHMKFFHHASPLIAILMGLGGAGWLSLWQKRGKSTVAAKSFGTLVILLVIVVVALTARDIGHPCKRKSDLRARGFAQWFWPSAALEGEVACADSDLGLNLSPEVWTDLSWAAMYHCNKRIYGPANSWGREPDWERIGPDWPLRCAVYRVPGFDFDEDGLAVWLKEMRSEYKLVSRQRYPFARYNRSETKLLDVEYLDIYTFVPK